jgi:hypothetical protein
MGQSGQINTIDVPTPQQYDGRFVDFQITKNVAPHVAPQARVHLRIDAIDDTPIRRSF